MRRWLLRFFTLLGLLAGFVVFQETVEFHLLKTWVNLTQAPSPGANPVGRAVADVVLREYYDRLEAMALYRNLEACTHPDCFYSVLYDLDPHANLYTSNTAGTAVSCDLQPNDQQHSSRIVYLRLRTFELDASCLEQIWAVVRQAQAPSSLVVDLRGNGGGYFEDALALGSFFIPSGTLLATPYERHLWRYADAYLNLPLRVTQGGLENRRGEPYPFKDNQPRKVKPQRIVVLIDQDSASASEIFANLLDKYAFSEVVIAGELSSGVGNTIMTTFPAGDFELDLPTAVLPGFSPYAEPHKTLEEVVELLGIEGFPAIATHE